ncbi:MULTISPECIES: lytic transglycosylase domain-containing protein [unclassified Burkholderia]|uniref:lytic transglycosylase domain-containing protein n=1 Tax=unclassified Burkholderia TaxID=2613784 RepID=UPI000F59273D|nr:MULTISPECIES: lytic transglycosylase domain-containing protein [unclassified Burkholderia]RQR93339.1 lytic transglycosylase domain-containing protein [Burkholderia sp. Bp8991]RQS21456.1 lytic transglycosylase domain-containing protein [Burkholderia sp. Bp8995]RQS37915.1 lytic transglycosylase domain-containing protein [Burkholderia sp. Bp8989]
MHCQPSSGLRKTIVVAACAGIGSAWSCAAHAQIFGMVAKNGVIVLTNVPTTVNLKVIVAAARPAARPAASTTKRVAPKHVVASSFEDVIAEASRSFNVPPELLRAVIDVESGYNPKAVSDKGALGLMQLMPETARRFSGGDMFDPRANVLTGARYLRFLLNLFKENVELTLAAYNAGENAVIRAGYRIPSMPQTREYVPRVLARYKRLLAAN